MILIAKQVFLRGPHQNVLSSGSSHPAIWPSLETSPHTELASHSFKKCRDSHQFRPSRSLNLYWAGNGSNLLLDVWRFLFAIYHTLFDLTKTTIPLAPGNRRANTTHHAGRMYISPCRIPYSKRASASRQYNRMKQRVTRGQQIKGTVQLVTTQRILP